MGAKLPKLGRPHPPQKNCYIDWLCSFLSKSGFSSLGFWRLSSFRSKPNTKATFNNFVG